MEGVKAIVGIGNPSFYRFTRHNVGKEFLYYLSQEVKLEGKGKYRDMDLYCPLAFMNLSGGPVKRWLGKLMIEPEQLLVVHDDIELKFGTVKVENEGSAHGHNGVRSIIESLKTDEFKRLRIGIGRPDRSDEVRDYVLSRFDSEEMELLHKDVFPRCVSIVNNSLK